MPTADEIAGDAKLGDESAGIGIDSSGGVFRNMALNDLDLFLADGDDAVYSGTGNLIKVWFDSGYNELNLGDGIQLESTGPMALCKTSDVPGVDHSKTLTIDGIIWTVNVVQPDGTGMTKLILRK